MKKVLILLSILLISFLYFISLDKPKIKLSSDVQKFANVLEKKCHISSNKFYQYFNSETGLYNSSLNCSSSNLTSDDLDTFKVLKEVNGSLNLQDNDFNNINGLGQLNHIQTPFILYTYDAKREKSLGVATEFITVPSQVTFNWADTPNHNYWYTISTKSDEKIPVDEGSMQKIIVYKTTLSLSRNKNHIYIVENNLNQKFTTPLSKCKVGQKLTFDFSNGNRLETTIVQ